MFCTPFLRKDTVETTGAGDTFMACVLNTVLEKGLDSLSKPVLLRIDAAENKMDEILAAIDIYKTE